MWLVGYNVDISLLWTALQDDPGCKISDQNAIACSPVTFSSTVRHLFMSIECYYNSTLDR